MKFIRDGDTKEDIVSLRLVTDLNYDGEVLLVATGSDGLNWTVMVFKNGRYELIEYVADYIGIDVGLKGKMKEVK